MNLSNLACCCRKLALAGLVASFFRVRCMRSWRPFCWGWPDLMRSMPSGQTTLFKKALKDSKSVVFFGGGERLAGQQISAGMIGDGQGVAVEMVSQQKLAFVIGTPELIGTLA